MTGKLADLHPAVRAFLDFAAETRPGWDRAEVQGALTAAGNNRPPERSTGQHWAATLITASRLLADAEATPRDLLAQVRSPLAPVPASVTDLAAMPELAAAKVALAEARFQASAARADADAAAGDGG